VADTEVILNKGKVNQRAHLDSSKHSTLRSIRHTLPLNFKSLKKKRVYDNGGKGGDETPKNRTLQMHKYPVYKKNRVFVSSLNSIEKY
jgi:hypothetical protein